MIWWQNDLQFTSLSKLLIQIYFFPKYFFSSGNFTMQKKEKNKWFSFSLPMGNRHHIVRARFLLFFLLCTSLSHAKMETTERGCSSSSMMVCSYHVKKTPNVNLLKTTIMNEWFSQKESSFILKFDMKYWYICVLLYLTFQALLLALPLRKNHHRK